VFFVAKNVTGLMIGKKHPVLYVVNPYSQARIREPVVEVAQIQTGQVLNTKLADPETKLKMSALLNCALLLKRGEYVSGAGTTK